MANIVLIQLNRTINLFFLFLPFIIFIQGIHNAINAEIHLNIAAAHLMQTIEQIRIILLELDNIVTGAVKGASVEIYFLEQLHEEGIHVPSECEIDDLHFIDSIDVVF